MSDYSQLRVTMVQAPRWTIYTPPYAIAVLVGVLRHHGFTVAARDYDIDLYRAVDSHEKELWKDENSGGWDNEDAIRALAEKYDSVVEQFVEDILSTKPDVVGFSVKNRSRTFSLIMAEKLKARRPDLLVILGGPEMRDGLERFMTPYPFIDAVSWQEADLSFPSFLKKYVDAGRVAQSEPGFCYRLADGTPMDSGPIKAAPTVADLQMADYSDFDFSKYENPHALTMLLSRGCINRCSFCSEAPSFLKFRAMSGERVYQELKFHAATSSAQRPLRVYFNDSLLNGNLQELENLADLLIANPIPGGLTFGGMMLIRGEMTEELVRKLALAGLRETFFGMETGSEKMIKLMRKRFKLEDAERIIRYFYKYGISVTLSIIFGHPGETEEDYYDTIGFLKRNEAYVDKLLLNTLGLFGDTHISRNLEKYGIVDSSDATYWVGDEGANTFAVRRARQLNAWTMFRDSVGDIGAFESSFFTFDTARAAKAKMQSRTSAIPDAIRFCRQQALRFQPAESQLGCVDEIQTLSEDRVIVRGWAVEPGSGSPARHVVCVDADGVLVGYAAADIKRIDLVHALGPEARFAGWEMEMICDDAGKAARDWRFGIYLPDEDVCRPLNCDNPRLVSLWAYRRIEGYFDSVSRTAAKGWVWAPEYPDQRLTVSAWLDDVELASGLASHYRGDLKDAGHGDGCYHYDLVFSRPLSSDDDCKRVTVRVQEGNKAFTANRFE